MFESPAQLSQPYSEVETNNSDCISELLNSYHKYATYTRSMTISIDWRIYDTLRGLDIRSKDPSDPTTTVKNALKWEARVLKRIHELDESADTAVECRMILEEQRNSFSAVLFFLDMALLLRAVTGLKHLSILVHPEEPCSKHTEFLRNCVAFVLASMPISLRRLDIQVSYIDPSSAVDASCTDELCSTLLDRARDVACIQLTSSHHCRALLEWMEDIRAKRDCAKQGGEGCICNVSVLGDTQSAGWDVEIIHCV